MRLLIVSQYFWPENFRVNDLAAELIARGHEVTILTGEPNYPDGFVFPDYRHDPGRFATFNGAPVVRVPILPRGRGGARLALNYLSFVATASTLGVWKLRRGRYDAIFVFQTSPITAAIPALILRSRHRAPVLMWILDVWPDTLAAIGVVKSARLLRLVGHMVRAIYRRCDLILVQSRAFFANVLQHGGTEEQLRYFPNWPEPVFAPGQALADPAPELSAYEDCFKLLFAGNMGDAQDFPTLLDAAERLRDEPRLRWIIVGDGRVADMVRAEIERRGLGQQVLLLGRYPIERMPSFFEAADALLVSLRNEPIWAMTIPGKVQSYLAAGKPIIGVLNGEGARVIEESGAGLVAPAGDSAALAERIRTLMARSQDERSAMGARGSEYGHRAFDRTRLMDAVESWFAEAALRRNGSVSSSDSSRPAASGRGPDSP